MRSQPGCTLLESVFEIVDQGTRQTVESPTIRASRDGVIVRLRNHTLLISKDGTERAIDDSAAPIRNGQNEVTGVVLIFRDITERYHQERALQETFSYADNIIATLREPFLVLDKNLRIETANQAFYRVRSLYSSRFHRETRSPQTLHLP